MDKGRINEIVLVDSSTRIPKVQQTLHEVVSTARCVRLIRTPRWTRGAPTRSCWWAAARASPGSSRCCMKLFQQRGVCA